jgi:hypothetical protein
MLAQTTSITGCAGPQTARGGGSTVGTANPGITGVHAAHGSAIVRRDGSEKVKQKAKPHATWESAIVLIFSRGRPPQLRHTGFRTHALPGTHRSCTGTSPCREAQSSLRRSPIWAGAIGSKRPLLRIFSFAVQTGEPRRRYNHRPRLVS